MVYKEVNEKAKSINLESNSNVEFLLIHGYTGSPTDFNDLPEYIYKKFNANVKAPILIGHGTKIEDLNNIIYEDFIKQLTLELEEDIKKGKKVFLIGYSFGALLALSLATKFPVEGVISISPPYLLKFPFNVPGLRFIKIFKKYWKKRISSAQKKDMKNRIYYEFMPSLALDMVKKTNKDIKKNLSKIYCPIMNIHSEEDIFGKSKSSYVIERKTNSKHKKTLIFDLKGHNIFYSDKRDKLLNEIASFIKKVSEE